MQCAHLTTCLTLQHHQDTGVPEKSQEFASQNVSFNQELFQNLQTIKVLGLADTFTQRYQNQQKESMCIQLDRNRYQQRGSRGSILISLVEQVIGYACYGFAIFQLWQGQIIYGTIMVL